MTLTEKLLARAGGQAHVEPGDNVWVNVDILMTHDVCGPGTIGVFKREFGKTARVWDRQKVVIIPDHYIFTADSMSNRNVDILREYAAREPAGKPRTIRLRFKVSPVAILGEGRVEAVEIAHNELSVDETGRIVARATDDMGHTQPATRDPDRRTYMINHLVPTAVTVR